MTKSPLERSEAQKWLELIQILQAEVEELKDLNKRLRSELKDAYEIGLTYSGEANLYHKKTEELEEEILLLRGVIKNLGAGGATSEWPWKPSEVSPEK